ncbi:hypothetical protein DERP_006911 [Dermatophagoides pteronyssinus]|uniref:Transmembrane protein n=1 Tax=Dermatophagoides pteronyssinus TaxID=6956 RepID=A0ABQ8ISC8_DERPT|nr:hypothetical protein DERP_006911 [Dermatophagoides pteronyssinus]
MVSTGMVLLTQWPDYKGYMVVIMEMDMDKVLHVNDSNQIFFCCSIRCCVVVVVSTTVVLSCRSLDEDFSNGFALANTNRRSFSGENVAAIIADAFKLAILTLANFLLVFLATLLCVIVVDLAFDSFFVLDFFCFESLSFGNDGLIGDCVLIDVGRIIVDGIIDDDVDVANNEANSFDNRFVMAAFFFLFCWLLLFDVPIYL